MRFIILLLALIPQAFAQQTQDLTITATETSGTLTHKFVSPFVVPPACTAAFDGKSGTISVDSSSQTVINLSGSFNAGDKIVLHCALAPRAPCRNCPPPK